MQGKRKANCGFSIVPPQVCSLFAYLSANAAAYSALVYVLRVESCDLRLCKLHWEEGSPPCWRMRGEKEEKRKRENDKGLRKEWGKVSTRGAGDEMKGQQRTDGHATRDSRPTTHGQWAFVKSECLNTLFAFTCSRFLRLWSLPVGRVQKWFGGFVSTCSLYSHLSRSLLVHWSRVFIWAESDYTAIRPQPRGRATRKVRESQLLYLRRFRCLLLHPQAESSWCGLMCNWLERKKEETGKGLNSGFQENGLACPYFH